MYKTCGVLQEIIQHKNNSYHCSRVLMLLSPVGDFAVACETITCIIIKRNLVYFFILLFFHELQEWGLYCHQVRVSLLCCGRKGQYQYKCWHRIFFLSVNQCNQNWKLKKKYIWKKKEYKEFYLHIDHLSLQLFRGIEEYE